MFLDLEFSTCELLKYKIDKSTLIINMYGEIHRIVKGNMSYSPAEFGQILGGPGT